MPKVAKVLNYRFDIVIKWPEYLLGTDYLVRS